MAVQTSLRRPRRHGKLPSRVLGDIVRRVVEVSKPERIVLFGSAASGTMRADSDVDLLVVKGGRFHRGHSSMPSIGICGGPERQWMWSW